MPRGQAYRVNYDWGADDYAAHRRLHPRVFQELSERGGLGAGALVLEVGCGTGNYVQALAESFGCTAYGLDPSAAMLAHARSRPGAVGWVLGRAEQLGFAGITFDLIFAVDVIHHVSERAAFFREAARTLRTGGRVCIVTDSAEIIRRREVLSGYFPETVDVELARYPRIAQLEGWMAAAGLATLGAVAVQAPYQVTTAQPFRDRAYSSLHLISERAWQAGLARLERDLARGPIHGASRYACVWGRKPAG